MTSCGIYKIRNIINDHIYVGSAANFIKREYLHFKTLEENKHHSKYLQNAYNLYNKENFMFEIIEELELDKKKLIEREQYWIDNLKPEYNICKIAGSRIGVSNSPEAIKRTADKNRGRKHTKEAIEKMKEKRSIQIFSEESKKKMSSSAKQRIGEKANRATLTNEQVRLIKIDIKNNMKLIEIAKKFNTNKCNISDIKTCRSWRHILI